MLHEYECQACGATFEELVRSSEDPDDVPCPRCDAPRAHRVAFCRPTHSGRAGDAGCSGFV